MREKTLVQFTQHTPQLLWGGKCVNKECVPALVNHVHVHVCSKLLLLISKVQTVMVFV